MDFDCSMCAHFLGPPEWPDVKKVSRCGFHEIPLDFELGANYYKLGTWFCKYFKPDRAAYRWPALEEFETIKEGMEDNIIYSGYDGKFLGERKI